jgi:IS605 OrfB family transposase
VACCVKVKIPDTLAHGLDDLLSRCSLAVERMLADLETGAVRKLGICPARTKFVFRRRRKNLQRAGNTRLLKKLYRKQRRRMSYENHRATRAVVDYAATHRRAVVMERLENVRSRDSKIRGYSERNQWAFAQFGSMLRYKCALRGIPLVEVPAAYTSQECSRCGSIHKPIGKHYKCETCGHNDHRDANAAFVIGFRAYACLLVGVAMALSVSWLRCIGNAQAENLEVPYADN